MVEGDPLAPADCEVNDLGVVEACRPAVVGLCELPPMGML